MEFSVVEGDIAAQSADALVSAAETSLEMEGEVAGAIRHGADGPIEDDAKANAPIGLGEVAVTDAYDLDAEYVIHAAAVPSFGGGRASAASIRASTQNALRRADSLECESLAIPIIGTGAQNYRFKDGARIICEVIADFEPEYLSDVRVIAYREEKYDYVVRIADAVQSRRS